MDDYFWTEVELLKKREEYDQVQILLQKAVKEYPDDPALVHLDIQIQFIQGKGEVENLVGRARQFSTYLPLQRDVVAILLERGDVEQATEKMAENFKIFGPSADLWTDYGVIFRHKNERNQAEMCFQRAISLDYQSEYSWFNLGNLYLDEGRCADAEQVYLRAIRIDDQNLEIWVQLVYSVLARMEYLIALRFIAHAQKRVGDFPILFYLQSLASYELGKKKEAKWAIHQALKNGNRKIFWEHLILLLEEEGIDTTDAKEFSKKAK